MNASEHPNAPLKTIAIIGGGTAGWMTAALLSKLFIHGYDITLVESEEIGAIGVGEATIPAIRNYTALAGVDQIEMIRATQATFKLGIEFVDWREQGSSYIHGFGKIGQDLMWLHTHQFWLKYAERGAVKHFDHYALNCVAARKNRFAMPDPRQAGSPVADIDYAYHFDASLFAAFQRRQAEGRGVTRIEGRIVATHLRGEDGFLDRVVLADGREVGADLFIDCSGMRALLIGEALGVPYENWRHWLPCDRALAAPCANAPELFPYTRSTARGAGWQWRIPLQHRIGNGHVYSSDHISDDEAAAVLLANLDGELIADPRLVRFTPGKRRACWEKNVVAIGLSSGFLEPLESTSIHLIQTAILRLIALFPGRGWNSADIAEYNRQSEFEFCDVRDFIIAHYKVTNREDTPFWAYVKHMDVPDSLAERLELFTASGRFFAHGKAELFREESWVQVLLGQGLPMRYDPMIDMIPDEQALAFLHNIEEVIDDCATAMQTHAEFIARYCKAPDPARESRQS